MFSRLVIAGTHTGCGKTTLALGLMLALQAKGLTVQPFKVGPDFIDPSLHTQICSPRRSSNLDGWLCNSEQILSIFQRSADNADICIIEGVMGLHDGSNSLGENSTASIAKLLAAPVVLVIDGEKLASSAGAIALGFQQYDQAVPIVGVIFNRVASQAHFNWLKEAVENKTHLKVLGYLPPDPAIVLAERHLGLVPAQELALTPQFQTRLIELLNTSVDLEGLVALAREAPDLQPMKDAFMGKTHQECVRIAVAMDKAFNFYYWENLDLLERNGAELTFFSPLDDDALPESVDAIYIGGGFPEMFAAMLAQNTSMQHSIRQAYQADMPIYAECGGLMYLCQAIRDLDGNEWKMVGIVPAKTDMTAGSLSIGYVEVSSRADTPISRKEKTYRGQVFHRSRLVDVNFESCFTDDYHVNGSVGYLSRNLLATYVHAHFGGEPELAENFVAAARKYSERVKTT